MSDAAAAVADPAGGSTSTTRATRAALEYLQLSGATPISIRATESGGSKTRFGKVDPNAAIVVWCEETRARPVIRLARRYAGPGASVTAASAALRKAAGDMRIVLTPDATAMERATAQARRLDQFIEDLHARGAMKQFTKSFKATRLALAATGQGFMSYKVAEMRFRKALIPLLQAGGQPAVGAPLFKQVFGL